ncbi:5-formyltetrahydrofolate cyclo-ligase [Bifidobacterium mongoliense]|uniref:5-formyltetrahydrofolate cyclo-ligase n=2 Tax=Bifidobacterium mongoliense TaxID=518643 RepID=A0A423UEV2_9BIFI|nr:5-formyltetrahydrofolate cyclo-ligase [Bifidobacterium mongoliense]
MAPIVARLSGESADTTSTVYHGTMSSNHDPDTDPSTTARRKRRWRSAALRRRRDITPDQLERAGLMLARRAARYVEALRPGTVVAGYIAMGHEIPTTPTLDDWLARGLTVLVPRLGTGREIRWGEYTGSGDLEAMPRMASGGLRPDEPRGDDRGPQALRRARTILIPALAVDGRGLRLGRGAGWYDRALLHRSPEATTVAVCWPWEIVDAAVPCEGHDVPVDHVIRL